MLAEEYKMKVLRGIERSSDEGYSKLEARTSGVEFR